MDMNNLIGCTSTEIIRDKHAAKKKLVSSLLRRFLPEQADAEKIVSLYNDRRGCPHLSTHLPIKLNVSFSYCENRIWSAMAVKYPIGIDVENANSFSPDYPFDLIFSKDEQRRYQEFNSSKTMAAAAIWSCKEAVAKSRQTGFKGLGPLDIHIGRIIRSGDRFDVEVVADQRYIAVTEKTGSLWRTLAGPEALR